MNQWKNKAKMQIKFLVFITIVVLVLLQIEVLKNYSFTIMKIEYNIGCIFSTLLVLLLILYFFIKNLKNEKIIEIDEKSFLIEKKIKDDFVRKISHEIRTPLNAIIGFSQLLGVEENKDETEIYIDRIRNSAFHLLGLVNDILDVSKLTSNKTIFRNDIIDVKKVIEKNINELKILAEKNKLVLKSNISSDIPKEIILDEIKFNQILKNILGNATKFTHSGSITIRLRRGTTEDTQEFLKFEIIDTGIGIKEPDVNLIFEKFKQFENELNVEGSGLGLSIVKELIEKMNGEIKAHSKYETGTIIAFTLPLVEVNTLNYQELGIFDNIKFNIRLEEKKILVVEDNEINILLLKGIFKNLKMNNISYAKDGIDALKMISENNYDIILLDIIMPRLDGVETIKKIRTMFNCAELPVIAMTANVLSEQLETYKEVGFNDCISKPLDIELMVKTLCLNLHIQEN